MVNIHDDLLDNFRILKRYQLLYTLHESNHELVICDNLILRGLSVSNNVFVMCGKCEYSMNHLFFSCSIA